MIYSLIGLVLDLAKASRSNEMSRKRQYSIVYYFELCIIAARNDD